MGLYFQFQTAVTFANLTLFIQVNVYKFETIVQGFLLRMI